MTLLVGRQEGHPACKKTEWWGAGVVICLERRADLHMAHIFCFSKIQIGFTSLVPAHLSSPGKRADKRVCVCVRIRLHRVENMQYFLNVVPSICNHDLYGVLLRPLCVVC